MKYYKISTKDYFNERIASYADFIDNTNDEVFKSIGDGEIILNTSVFDYFYLSSFDKEEYWEWNLFDVHKFYGKAGWLTPNLLISEKLKKILNLYIIAEPHFYYYGKLIYKNKKLDYYVIQFTGKKMLKNMFLYIDFNKSIFLDSIKKENIIVDNSDEFLFEYKRIYKENGIENKLKNRKLVLNKELDFFPIGTFMNDNIVSERLKKAIEENGITGFEFSELDYEVIIELE